MITRGKITATVIGIVASGLLLTGCGAEGAQNPNPVGKVPGSEESATRTDPGQRNTSPCQIASEDAVDALDQALGSHDNTDLANVREGDGGWYVAASVAPNTKDDPNDDEIGVWVTTSDPTADTFDGEFAPLNENAKAATTDATTAPSEFSATSDAAKQVESCAAESVDH